MQARRPNPGSRQYPYTFVKRADTLNLESGDPTKNQRDQTLQHGDEIHRIWYGIDGISLDRVRSCEQSSENKQWSNYEVHWFSNLQLIPRAVVAVP